MLKMITPLILIAAAFTLTGCPEESMLKYYISGSVVDSDGNRLNDIMLSVDICDDGSLEAKEVTFDGGGLTIIESSWEDCSVASFKLEDIDFDREGGPFAEKTVVIDMDPWPGDGKYEYYTEMLTIELEREADQRE